MILDLTAPFTDLDGKQIEKATLGSALATQLSISTTGDAVKHMTWAILLHANTPLDLDKSDMETLRKFVENHGNMIALAKAPILEAIQEAKETK